MHGVPLRLRARLVPIDGTHFPASLSRLCFFKKRLRIYFQLLIRSHSWCTLQTKYTGEFRKVFHETCPAPRLLSTNLHSKCGQNFEMALSRLFVNAKKNANEFPLLIRLFSFPVDFFASSDYA